MEFSELVDISELRELCESFTHITGAVTGILDLEGNILTATGWQNICTCFHRVHPATARRCRESDTVLAGRLGKGERYNVYKCQNGLIDVAVPITIGGEHIANLFTGQFFFEPPDKEYFVRQAEEFGFDKDSYIEALNNVPIFSDDKVRSMMEFFTRLAQLIGEMGLARKNLKNANAELRKHQEHLEELVMERTAGLSRANRELQVEIAERKRADEALRESENKFSKAFQATPSVLVIASLADGRYMEVNEAFERVMGYRRDEVIGRSALELNIWQNPEERAIVLRMLAEGKKVRDLEIGFKSKSGTILVGLYSAEIIEIGAEQCLLSLVNDITGRKMAEEELRHSEERYRRLYNETPVMLHSIDHDGRLVSVSNYWLETLGYERNEVLGRISTEFYTAASRYYATEVVLPEFFRTGSCKEVPYQIVKKNGEILDVRLSAIAELDSDEKVVRSLAVMVDVTARKRAEEEIERLNVSLATRAADLEDANVELEAFNYTVAHDLRQPLNVIGLNCQAIDVLCGNFLSKECKSYVQGSYEGTLRMNRLIEALLSFSRMAHAELNWNRVDLSSMAKEVAEELEGTEVARRVTFRIADGICADGDPNLLRVVLANLLGNAWKYIDMQEEGIIEFGAAEIDERQTCFVRDNGPGFNMADADKLFAPFQRLPGTEERRGSGIGLATVERIIRRHGGRVWAEGEPGKGATFWFTLSANGGST